MQDIQNDKDIALLVESFYTKVQKDERLDYIFNNYANVDWEEHLPKMVDFWSNILFQTRRYKGRPFRQHLPLPIEKQDFGRWLKLFEQTVDDHFEGPKAEHAKEMANKVASAFTIRLEMEGKFKNSESNYG